MNTPSFALVNHSVQEGEEKKSGGGGEIHKLGAYSHQTWAISVQWGKHPRKNKLKINEQATFFSFYNCD